MSSREQAEALIADGFRVWPLRGKFPTKKGFARTDGPDVCASPDDFDAEGVDVAVLCGPCPAAGPGARFVLVDYDGPVPADQRVGGEPTLTSKNGAHEWYSVPAHVQGFRQTTGLRKGDGWAVDTRDFGGYGLETKGGEPLWDAEGEAFPRDLTQAEVEALFGPAKAEAEAPAQPYVPPAHVLRPSKASTQALATRWHTDPSDTNRLAGAVGAVLGGAWGWSDVAITEYFATWLQHSNPRHLQSALDAAVTYRAGGRIYGFPKLQEFIGQPFEAERPAANDAVELWAAIEAAEAEAPATDAGPWLWTTGVQVAAWDPPPIPWLSEELCLAPGAPGLITGYGGTGKTTFVQHLALCVASTNGKRLLDQYEVRHGAVTHLDYEQGADLTKRRYLDLGLGELPVEAQARLRFASFPTTKCTDAEALERLLLAARGQALLIVDSLVAATTLEDENAATARAPLDVLGQVSELTGCVVLVIHHSKKDRSNGRTSARGSSAITDAVSVHVTYERPDADGAGAPVTLQLEKVRHIMPTRSFALAAEPVRVWYDSATGRVTQVAAPPPAPDPKEAALLDVCTEAEALFRKGWTGTRTELRAELGARQNLVAKAINILLEQNVIIQDGVTRFFSLAKATQ